MIGRGVAGIGALMLAWPHLVRAQPPGSPSFHDAVAAAWARLPQRQAFAARQGVAAAQYAAGGALLPNAPFASGSYVNDKAGSNEHYITYQGQLGTPVWLPGEGTATQNAALARSATVSADLEAAHLALAVQVLDLTAQANFAANALDVARRRLAVAQALATDLAHRLQVGESSDSDALAADADAAGASVTLSSAEAQLATARAALAAVTGEEAIPRLAAPTPPLLLVGALTATHPELVAAERAVAAAQSQERLTRIENRDSPTVGLEVIHEVQGRGQPYDTRVGVVFRLPFATEARNAPLRAAAQEAVTQAAVRVALAQRGVVAGVRQAEATLAGAERGSAAAARAATDLDRRRGQIERAWRLGEMPLIEVVRSDALAFDAELARGRALTERDAARQRLRLAQGILP